MEMIAERGNGKTEGESGASPSQTEERLVLSEEEIERQIRIAQLEEELRRQLEKIAKEKQQLEEKAKSARETVFAEMREKYGMEENDFKDAFTDIQRKDEIEKQIMETIKQKGKDACKEKKFKESAEKIRKITIIERMNETDIKKISVYIEEARKYIETQKIERGKTMIHHAGRMSQEALEMLRYIKENGGKIGWKEFLQWSKETLGLDGDTVNKRRWNLLTKEYIRREGTELVLTPKGYARLQEEGL